MQAKKQKSKLLRDKVKLKVLPVLVSSIIHLYLSYAFQGALNTTFVCLFVFGYNICIFMCVRLTV